MVSKSAKLLGWIMVVGVLILYLSPSKVIATLPSFPHADKLVHLFNFFFLGFAFKLGYLGISYKKITFGLICFGLLLEILQGLLLIGRSFDWMDLAADVLGLTLVIPLFPILCKVFPKSPIGMVEYD
ncbi:MAG: hypothetical protein ACMUEM_06460 [Flavobacteriales bacterium AspAUS03]